MLPRASCALLCLAACSFSTRLDGGDDTTNTQTLVDDALEGGTAIDGVVAGGRVDPDGFVLGGLHARAFTGSLVDASPTVAEVFAAADAATPVGAGYAQVPANWVLSRPRGLGLTSDGNFTVVYDGEILLPKGEVSLEVDADDRAVVGIRGKEVTATFAAIATMPLTVPEAGWYPIRAAIAEDSTNARLALTIVQGPVRTAADATRLRARVTSDRGLLVYVFDGQGFVGPRGHTARATIDEAFSTFAPPYDLTASIDRFSLRFAGQLRIDAPGSYTFDANLGIDTNDGWRLWIDGELVAHEWLGHPVKATGTVDLAAGWHTILVDYADEIGNAQIAVSMTGPDALAGGPIDPSHLRPVVVFGNTYTFSTTAATPIADVNSTFVTMPLPGDPLEVIDSVDYGFRIDNQDMNSLQVTLFDCSAGKPLTLATVPGYHYYPADKSCANQLTNPVVDWQFRLADTIAGNGTFVGSGQVRDYGLTALYHGGPKMPFAPVFSYTSGPKQIPARRFTAARAMGSLDGATVEIAVRTAADEAGLAAATFEVIRDGEPVDAVGAFAQYRVTLTTNGWISPVLDKVELDYVADE